MVWLFIGTRAAIQLLNDILDGYSTTIEYDGNFLQSHPDLSLRTKLAIIHRFNEKKILRASVGHLRAMWKYILDTGDISSPRELLNLPEDENERNSYSTRTHEKLILPTEATHQTELWSSIMDIVHRKLSEKRNIQEEPATEAEQPAEDSVIERAQYKPIIHDHSELREFEPNTNGLEGNRMKIAVLVASKVDHEVENAYDLPVVKILLQSIISTWSRKDREMFFINFYIGFDTGDKFYDSEFNMRNLRVAFEHLEKTYPIKFRIICTGDTHGAPARAWSVLGNVAYHDGFVLLCLGLIIY